MKDLLVVEVVDTYFEALGVIVFVVIEGGSLWNLLEF
jgi:hypothetical protein